MFKPKSDSLIHAICLMAFCAAINIVCSLLNLFVPLAGVFLVILLPLTSAIVEANFEERYFPIYAIATIGLSMAVTPSTFDFTLFYIVPSMLTGFVFGFAEKRGIPDRFAIFVASAVQTIVSLLFVPVIEFITERNIIDDLAEIFGISNRFFYDNAIFLIFFIFSLAQIILSFIVINEEMKKFGFVEKKDIKYQDLITPGACILAAIIGPEFVNTFMTVTYAFVGVCYYFATFVVIDQIKAKEKTFLIIDGSILLAQIFLYAGVNQFITDGKDFLLFIFAPVIISCVSIVHYFLKKPKE